MELYTGSILFPTHDEVEHLAMIEKMCGPIPLCYTKKLPRELSDIFDTSLTEEEVA
jgi:hypothetical protein